MKNFGYWKKQEEIEAHRVKWNSNEVEQEGKDKTNFNRVEIVSEFFHLNWQNFCWTTDDLMIRFLIGSD